MTIKSIQRLLRWGAALASTWRVLLNGSMVYAWILWKEADLEGRPYMAPVILFFAVCLSFCVLALFLTDRYVHENMKDDLAAYVADGRRQRAIRRSKVVKCERHVSVKT